MTLATTIWFPDDGPRTEICRSVFNPLNSELNPICHLLALLGAHHILHVSRIRVKGHFNPLNSELNPICHLLALLGDHHILHVSRIRVKVLMCKFYKFYICAVVGIIIELQMYLPMMKSASTTTSLTMEGRSVLMKLAL